MTATTCPSDPRGRPTAGEPRITVDAAGERDLRLMAGMITGLVGAMLLLVPHHLSNPTYALIARHPTVWGIGFLLSGLGLLAVDVLQARRPLLLALHMLVGAAWLLLAFGFLINKGWIGMAAWGVFGLGIAVEPFLSVHRAGAAVLASASPFSVLNALTASLLGVAMFVVLLTKRGYPFFSPVLTPMLFAATSMVVAGPLLLYALRRRPARPWPWFWGAHLLVGGFYLLYGVGSWRVQAWTGVLLYACLGGSLCLAPVLQDRLRTVASSSLAVRMSVFVSIALTVALVVTATIASRHFVRVYGVSEEAVRSLRESTFGVLLVSLTIAVIVVVYTARWVGAPLRDLSVVAGKLAGGDGAAVLPGSRVHEIQALVASFAEMRDRLAARTLEREQSLKRLEEQAGELRAARDAAESANRAKSVFLANMSHEIRTPMNAVLGFAQLLLRAPEVTPEHRIHLDAIVGAGNHLLALIDEILQLARIEAGRVVLEEGSVDLRSLLSDVERLFAARAASRNLRLLVEAADALPGHVVGDGTKLRQVLANLVGNALKFTVHGGVAVRAKADRSPAGTRLVVEVEDTGPGIAEGEMPRLFQKFEQTESGRRSRQGTGLGLALCREYVELMGGTIAARSTPGVGSVFRFEIPLRPADGPAEARPETEQRKVSRLCPGQSACPVLVVDDQEDNRRFLTGLLEAVGFEAREAVDGEQAVSTFAAWRPRLVMTDMRMPGIDGVEAIRRMRATPGGAAARFIIVTASAFDEDRARALGAGADAFITKPIRESVLFETMKRLLGVEYEYAAADAPHAAARDPAPTRASIAGLPAGLRDRLRRATVSADLDRMRALIAEAEAHDVEVARQLRALAERFAYRQLLDLLGRESEAS